MKKCFGLLFAYRGSGYNNRRRSIFRQHIVMKTTPSIKNSHYKQQLASLKSQTGQKFRPLQNKISGLAICALASTTFTFWACPEKAHGFEVYGEIGKKYEALGREAGPLGAPLSDESPAPFGGRFNKFANGYIYWHPQTGAHAVWGDIAQKWSSLGKTKFGYPTTDEMTTPDGTGRFNHFRQVNLPGAPETSIYWTPETGAWGVYGQIRKAWASQGWERGSLGYPTSDEYQQGGYRRSNFQGGYIIWSPDGGAVINKTK